MGLFDSKKKGEEKVAEEEKIKFFTPLEYDYKIPDSRKPIVVKKESKKASSKTKSTAKKADTEKKKSTAAKKAEPKKPAAKAAEVKKPAAKAEKTASKKTAAVKATVKPETKKPVANASSTKSDVKRSAAKTASAKTEAKKPAASAVKKDVTKKTASKKTAAKVTEPVEIVANETVTVGKAMRSGTFDIKKSKDGRFVFNLYSANKVIIATSQVYSSSQAAMTGVKSVMTNATKAEIEDTTLKTPIEKTYPKWEIYIDRACEYRFRLNASNATCICHAKAGYATKANCKRGIESIIRLAEDAQIDKSYLGDKK